MYNPEVPVGQYLNATSLNMMENTSETIPSTRSKNDHSIFGNKTRRISSKTPEISLSSVTLIRMEQLAPEGTTIANSDGRHNDHRKICCIFNIFSILLYRYTA